MTKRTIVVDIVAVGLLTALLHRGAIVNAWYWEFWWMDVVVHFFGGLFVGLIVLSLITDSGMSIAIKTSGSFR